MGNFDRKNIIVHLRFKDCMLDDRIKEYIKNWDFTMKESDDFMASLDSPTSNPVSEKIMRFILEYNGGYLRPDRYNTYEPIRLIFDESKITQCISWMSFPAGGVYFKKLRKFDMEISNETFSLSWLSDNPIVHRPTAEQPEYLGKITFWFAKQRKIDMDFLKKLLIDFCEYMHTDFGYIVDQENKEILFDPYRPERVGTFVEKIW